MAPNPKCSGRKPENPEASAVLLHHLRHASLVTVTVSVMASGVKSKAQAPRLLQSSAHADSLAARWENDAVDSLPYADGELPNGWREEAGRLVSEEVRCGARPRAPVLPRYTTVLLATWLHGASEHRVSRSLNEP